MYSYRSGDDVRLGGTLPMEAWSLGHGWLRARREWVKKWENAVAMVNLGGPANWLFLACGARGTSISICPLQPEKAEPGVARIPWSTCTIEDSEM